MIAIDTNVLARILVDDPGAEGDHLSNGKTISDRTHAQIVKKGVLYSLDDGDRA